MCRLDPPLTVGARGRLDNSTPLCRCRRRARLPLAVADTRRWRKLTTYFWLPQSHNPASLVANLLTCHPSRRQLDFLLPFGRCPPPHLLHHSVCSLRRHCSFSLSAMDILVERRVDCGTVQPISTGSFWACVTQGIAGI